MNMVSDQVQAGLCTTCIQSTYEEATRMPVALPTWTTRPTYAPTLPPVNNGCDLITFLASCLASKNN